MLLVNLSVSEILLYYRFDISGSGSLSCSVSIFVCQWKNASYIPNGYESQVDIDDFCPRNEQECLTLCRNAGL